MRYLTRFVEFNHEAFFEKKKLVFMKAAPWTERDSGGSVDRTIGAKVTLLVKDDATDYGEDRDGAKVVGCNAMEMFTVKVPNKTLSEFEAWQPLSTPVRLENVQKATVWGDYKDNLSIVCDVAQAPTGNKQA